MFSICSEGRVGGEDCRGGGGRAEGDGEDRSSGTTAGVSRRRGEADGGGIWDEG